MFYASDTSYNNFIYTIADSKADYFYGIFINDSVKINKSKFFSENESCKLRIVNELNNINSNLNANNVSKDNLLIKNEFYNITDNQPLKLNFEKNKFIILIFSYKMGSLRKKEFKEIETMIENKKDYEIVILNMDRIADLK